MALKEIKQSVLNKARKDKFIMVITLPKAIREINTPGERHNNKVIGDSIQFSIYGVVVPAIKVADLEAGYSGQSFKFTTHKRPQYENIFINFTIDNEFNNYWTIFKWINLLNNNEEAIFYAEKDPVQNKPFDEYSTNITIYGLDEYDHRKIQFDFIGAVPVSLGQIAYNYRDATEAESTFEFAFSQLHSKLLP
jgi:hypothetical protein